jgi:hypothetical protein
VESFEAIRLTIDQALADRREQAVQQVKEEVREVQQLIELDVQRQRIEALRSRMSEAEKKLLRKRALELIEADKSGIIRLDDYLYLVLPMRI